MRMSIADSRPMTHPLLSSPVTSMNTALTASAERQPKCTGTLSLRPWTGVLASGPRGFDSPRGLRRQRALLDVIRCAFTLKRLACPATALTCVHVLTTIYVRRVLVQFATVTIVAAAAAVVVTVAARPPSHTRCGACGGRPLQPRPKPHPYCLHVAHLPACTY